MQNWIVNVSAGHSTALKCKLPWASCTDETTSFDIKQYLAAPTAHLATCHLLLLERHVGQLLSCLPTSRGLHAQICRHCLEPLAVFNQADCKKFESNDWSCVLGITEMVQIAVLCSPNIWGRKKNWSKESKAFCLISLQSATCRSVRFQKVWLKNRFTNTGNVTPKMTQVITPRSKDLQSGNLKVNTA